MLLAFAMWNLTPAEIKKGLEMTNSEKAAALRELAAVMKKWGIEIRFNRCHGNFELFNTNPPWDYLYVDFDECDLATLLEKAQRLEGE